MRRKSLWKSALLMTVFGCCAVWLSGPAGQPGLLELAHAADTLNIDGLPKDPKAYRAQVEQILKKVDALTEKLKGNQNARPIVLDLLQTRDDILREIPKVESTPDGSKWSLQEGRDSVDAKLKLLKDQYDKASGL
jgi:hypothetical protein